MAEMKMKITLDTKEVREALEKIKAQHAQALKEARAVIEGLIGEITQTDAGWGTVQHSSQSYKAAGQWLKAHPESGQASGDEAMECEYFPIEEGADIYNTGCPQPGTDHVWEVVADEGIIPEGPCPFCGKPIKLKETTHD